MRPAPSNRLPGKLFGNYAPAPVLKRRRIHKGEFHIFLPMIEHRHLRFGDARFHFVCSYRVKTIVIPSFSIYKGEKDSPDCRPQHLYPLNELKFLTLYYNISYKNLNHHFVQIFLI